MAIDDDKEADIFTVGREGFFSAGDVTFVRLKRDQVDATDTNAKDQVS